MRDSGQLLQLVHAGMVKAGLDVAAIYARLGYDAEKLPLRELRTEHQLQVFFWQTVEAITGDADIGLSLCPHLPLYRGEVIEYLLHSSKSFGEGCERTLKYLRLVSDALDVQLLRDGPTAHFVVKSAAVDAPPLRHTEIGVLHSLIALCRSVTDGAFAATAVHLRCEARSPMARYEAVFGCPVHFGAAQNRVHFASAILDTPSPHWDPDLAQLHEDFAAKRLTKIERQDLIERIRAVFARRLELEHCELEDVAKEVRIPSRRLRFELAQMGLSFSQVRADFRYSLARRLLGRSDEAIEDIVYLTGFSEPSTFYRAFKRWSGLTPLQYREKKRGMRP